LPARALGAQWYSNDRNAAHYIRRSLARQHASEAEELTAESAESAETWRDFSVSLSVLLVLRGGKRKHLDFRTDLRRTTFALAKDGEYGIIEASLNSLQMCEPKTA
jgi:hypothetical protein